jgi:hypothetical protein
MRIFKDLKISLVVFLFQISGKAGGFLKVFPRPISWRGLNQAPLNFQPRRRIPFAGTGQSSCADAEAKTRPGLEEINH